jgi:hypothetical protein
MKALTQRKRKAIGVLAIVIVSTNIAQFSSQRLGLISNYNTKELLGFLSTSNETDVSTQAVREGDDQNSTNQTDRVAPMTTSTTDNAATSPTPLKLTGIPRLVVPLPFPVQLMEQYIQWHSEDSLQASPENRTFAVAYYSCPHRAGNFINNFLNSLKWAIITNRTLLVTYRELAVVCRTMNETSLANSTNTSMSYIMDLEPFTNDSSIDETGNCAPKQRYYNSQQDCARVIERAAWLPSYEKWSKHSVLQNETIVELDFWSTMPRGIPYFAALSNPWQDGNERHAGVDAKSNLRLVQFPALFDQDDYLTRPKFRRYLLKTTWSSETAKDLYAEGLNFLYGMLYRKSFSPTDFAVEDHEGRNDETIFTVGLHSRHKKNRQTGGQVIREVKCLHEIINKRFNRTIYSSCKVYLMADRELTLKILSRYVHKLGCEPVTADHKKQESGILEHGPYAGIGFFQDLELLARGTRHGFVGATTSSTEFVLSTIVYDSFMSFWNDTGGKKVENLEVCRFRTY